ncbi:MAG: SPFH domain-containing protein [Clostridia bacterium]|nr:SPFH domain-containing protein [Clostridia bacterium]
MGIFKNLKHYFSSDIYPDVNKMPSIVTPFKTSGGYIKTNSKVGVPKGYAFVLGHGGKALDCFMEGEYILAPSTLPECCKKLKIHKMDKQGKIKKKFKADAYFINLKSFDATFKTGQCIEMGNRAMGIFTAGAEGKANIKVSEPKLMMVGLLQEFAYLRLGEAEKIIESWVSELVIKCFQKHNFALSELVDNNPVVEEKTKSDVAMGLSRCGLVLEGFEFDKILLPKKYRKKAEENLKQKEKNKKIDSIANQQVEQTTQTETQIEDEKCEEVEVAPIEQIDKQENIQSDVYVPFGDFEISQQQASYDKDVQEQPVQEALQPQQYVDLNIDNIIKNTPTQKRCLACGAVVDEFARFCSMCGQKIE